MSIEPWEAKKVIYNYGKTIVRNGHKRNTCVGPIGKRFALFGDIEAYLMMPKKRKHTGRSFLLLGV